MTEYWVEVKTGTGKNLVIFKWDEQAGADYLLRQIQRWSGQEHKVGDCCDDASASYHVVTKGPARPAFRFPWTRKPSGLPPSPPCQPIQ